MGVTNLWTILAPVKQHKSLSSLRGQTIAVDLSIWVCENQCVKSMQGVVARPYLRNLFFRVSYLTQQGVKLVFVIEGAAPQLKWQEMGRRQQALGRGRGGRAGRGGRSNFNARLRECCQLLDLLGIPYVHSRGEAEAMCAALDAAGLVDACITDDGDVFLYGARTVYKNFTMNNKDPHVESYSMAAIEQELGISRESLVGVALLLGCDYLPGGVSGVGVDRVIKYLQSLKGVDILQRFLQWRQMTVSQCVSKIEIFIRQKSLATQDFPQAQVIDEFLSTQETIPKQAFTWRRPHIVKTQEYAETKMEWPPDYTTEKILPLVTLWDLVHIADRTVKNVPHLKPSRIVKPRVRQSVPVYEVEWFKSVDDVNTSSEFYTTMEEQGLFARAFPDLVAQFEEEMDMKKEKKKKGSKKSKKKEHPENELGDLSSQMLLLELQGDKDAVQETRMKECIHKVSTHMSPPDTQTHVTQFVQSTSTYLKEPSMEGLAGGPCATAKSRRKPSRSIKDVDELDVRVKQENKPSLKMSRNSHTVSDCPVEDGLCSKIQNEIGLEGAKLHKGTSLELQGTIGTSNKYTTSGDIVEQDNYEIPYKSNSIEDSHKPESDSDSDRENDEVFLSLSQRLQKKLGHFNNGRSVSGGFEQCLALKQHTKMKCTSESGVNSVQSEKPARTRNNEREQPGTFCYDSCSQKPDVSYNSGKKSPVMIQFQGRKKKANGFTDFTKPDQPNSITHDLVSDVNVESKIARTQSACSDLRDMSWETGYDSTKHISLPVDSADCRVEDKCSDADGEGQFTDSLTPTGPPLTDLSRDFKSGVETSEGSNLRLPCPQANNSPAVSEVTPSTFCGEHDFSHVAFMTEVHTPDINCRPSRPSASSEIRAINDDYLDDNASNNTHHNSNTNIHVPCHSNSAPQINSSSSNIQLPNVSPHHSSLSPKPMKPIFVKSHLFQYTPSPLTRAERSTLYPQTPDTGSGHGQSQGKVLLYQTPSPMFSVKPCNSDSVNSRHAHAYQTLFYQTPLPASTSAVDSTLQFGNFSMQASLLNDTLANVTANCTSVGSSFVSYRTPVGGSLSERRHSVCSSVNGEVDSDEGSPEMSSSDSLCPPSRGGNKSTTCNERYDINFHMLSLDSKSPNEKPDISAREYVASSGQPRGGSSNLSTSLEIGKNKNGLEHDVNTHSIAANGSSEKCARKTSESVPGTYAEQNTTFKIMFPGHTATSEQILNVNMLSSQSQIPPCSQRTVPNRSKLSLRRKGNRSQSSLMQHEMMSYDADTNLRQSHQTRPVSATDLSGESCTGELSTGPASLKCSTEDSVIDLCEDSDSEVWDAEPIRVANKCSVQTDKVFPKALEGDRTFLQMLDDPSRRVKISAKQPVPNFYEDSDSDTVPEWETETKGAETLFREINNEIGIGNSCSDGFRDSGETSCSREKASAQGGSTHTVRRESTVDVFIKRDVFVETESRDGCGANETTMMESPVSLSDRLKLRLSNNAQNALKALASRRNFGIDVNVKPVRKT